MVASGSKLLLRNDARVIIHFDYDCFYASVFEAENPALKSLPLAVQQKQIIVTCNYEARRRGLHKLQLITEAKKVCPDVVIVLGEDLTRFRDASKDLYNFLRAFSWSDKVERLGFDEVWIDVTDIVDYNCAILNRNNLENAFFQLSRTDPTAGFTFDATTIAGHTYPSTPYDLVTDQESDLHLRLLLGSHLSTHIRRRLEHEKGYTTSVGISTSKLLSKLVGNVNKPKAQTTLIPPYESDGDNKSNVIRFIDDHDVGRIPWIGFKLAQKLRGYVLGRPAEFHDGLVYGNTKENVTVGQARRLSGLGPDLLEKVLGGPGTPHGIGAKVYMLLHGIDDAEVIQARNIPRQISIEDSYVRLVTFDEVLKELKHLTSRLIARMRMDLTSDDAMDDETQPLDGVNFQHDPNSEKDRWKSLKWIGHPETLRLSTRPRPPLNPDGSRSRTFNRISRSMPCPKFIFNLEEDIEVLTSRLVTECLVPMFKKLHPEKSGWNLSLVNVAVTNMTDAAGESREANGRDIAKMFKRQPHVLEEFRVKDDLVEDMSHTTGVAAQPQSGTDGGVGDMFTDERGGEEGNGIGDLKFTCPICEATVPGFARVAHERFHFMDE